MFSPLDTPEAQEWFRRFDAALRRLPVEERTRQREEMQQHLEGLVTAHEALGQLHEAAWKAALTQFGDPAQIGRKIAQEWRQGRTGFRADMAAILFGIGLQVIRAIVVNLLFSLWFSRLYNPGDTLYAHGKGMVNIWPVIQSILAIGGSIVIYAAIGRKYPSQAIKGAFYTDLLSNLWFWTQIAIAASEWRNAFVHSMLWLPFWIIGHITVSYLASVTKRGWYRPTLADFKLALPRLRRQTSR